MKSTNNILFTGISAVINLQMAYGVTNEMLSVMHLFFALVMTVAFIWEYLRS